MTLSFTEPNPEPQLKECAICLEKGEDEKDFVPLRCGHCFHPRCVVKWLQNDPPWSCHCPLCRDGYIHKPSTNEEEERDMVGEGRREGRLRRSIKQAKKTYDSLKLCFWICYAIASSRAH